jgi:hypothetical protein
MMSALWVHIYTSAKSVINMCGYAIIGVDAVLLIASILYFILATDANKNITYISDLDHGRLDYKIGISILVLLQILSNAIYARKQKHYIEFICVTIAMILAVSGWCVVSFSPDSQQDRDARNNSTTHVMGARLYVFGSLTTALFMCRDAWKSFKNTHTYAHLLLFIAITTAIVLACLFGLLFSQHDSHDWIYEHLLFLAYIVCHLLFFINIARDNDEVNYKVNDEVNDEVNYEVNDENDEVIYEVNDEVNDEKESYYSYLHIKQEPMMVQVVTL